jgi:S1-C subfamily serine protease
LRKELLLPLAVLALGLAAAGGFFAASAALGEGSDHETTRVQAVPRQPLIVPPGLGRAFVGLALSDEPNGAGVRIEQVISGSPADNAGLKQGDVITAVGGQSISTVNDVQNALENRNPGDRVIFTVRRDNQSDDVAVTLGRREQVPLQPTPPSGGNNPHLVAAYMGVSLADITPQIEKQLGLDRDHGVVIVEVEASGPAQKAGLQRGDVILMIGSQQVSSAADARAAILDYDPGDSVSVRVLRGSQDLSIPVELGTRPGVGTPMDMMPGRGPFGAQPGTDAY